ncbi:MAG: hypothetical protein GY805_29735 [Chloroflexi bacterium]|nr:hypothetical protein [Chloroflexota bacterium]
MYFLFGIAQKESTLLLQLGLPLALWPVCNRATFLAFHGVGVQNGSHILAHVFTMTGTLRGQAVLIVNRGMVYYFDKLSTSVGKNIFTNKFW